ncbi:hypothetical protein BDZ89DRAFT_565820 [Hymenopellis radicata]|nr:hypothetical protein BDZ89DRAFT_565820 [Hymenopellis radicata]
MQPAETRTRLTLMALSRSFLAKPLVDHPHQIRRMITCLSFSALNASNITPSRELSNHLTALTCLRICTSYWYKCSSNFCQVIVFISCFLATPLPRDGGMVFPLLEHLVIFDTREIDLPPHVVHQDHPLASEDVHHLCVMLNSPRSSQLGWFSHVQILSWTGRRTTCPHRCLRPRCAISSIVESGTNSQARIGVGWTS